MPRVNVDASAVLVLGVMGAAALAAVYVWRNGGVAAVAGDAVSGAVGAIGAAVGLPTPSQTTTDAAVARWIIDHRGYFEASKWAGVPALLGAFGMDAGSGTPPAPGTAAYDALILNWTDAPATTTAPKLGGDWFATGWTTDPEALAYEDALRAAAGARGGAILPITGTNGAAFGVYPKP